MKYIKASILMTAVLFALTTVAQTPAAGETDAGAVLETPEADASNTICGCDSRQPSGPIDPVRSIACTMVVDTLSTSNEAVKVVLFNDNTWCYVRNRDAVQDSTVYKAYWNTNTTSPYYSVPLNSLPSSVVISLVDELKHYHYPYKGRISSHYGVRHKRSHTGVDLPLSVGDSIYAVFDGCVRFSQFNNSGYGNLVIIRHDNGLETYMAHLSERFVEAGEWVTAGQVIGLGGCTGRSTGPHLHFETRYYGQSFDPERIIDFSTGKLRRETFLLKRSYFDIYSKYDQNFDDETANEQEDKRKAAETAAASSARYYVVRKGDTLTGIAKRNGTTVSRLCQLNGIKSSSILSIGKRLRVR